MEPYNRGSHRGFNGSFEFFNKANRKTHCSRSYGEELNELPPAYTLRNARQIAISTHGFLLSIFLCA
jgi:hypothetical protein